MEFVLPPEAPPPSARIPPIDFRAALNDEQFAAVTAPPGPMLVLAGAGSGKTRTLTYRVAHLLSQGVRPGEILLLTFTNKAAREMLHRVQDLTGIEPGRFWGGTFHSIGNRTLRLYGEAVGLPRNFTILDADESETLLKQAVETEDKTFFKEKTNPRPGPLFSVLSLARNTQVPPLQTVEQYFPQYLEVAHRFPGFAAAYERRKRDQKVVDYDDLLELWLKLLSTAPDIVQHFTHRFRHVLVDEYQDTNTLQSQIVDLIAGHHQVMAVGDDAQCIYTWRGAEVENILTFPDRHAGTQIYRIETNYRSTPEILTFANGVLAAQPKGRHFDKELRAARGRGRKPAIIQAMDDREQAAFVLKRIQALIEEEGVPPGGIAVLYRSHFLALEMQLALTRAGVPYTITSGVKFFERQHVRDLLAFINFVYNPANTSAWHRIAMLLPRVGEKNAGKIHAAALDHARLLQRNLLDALGTDDVLSKVPADARADWPGFVASLQQIHSAMNERSPAEAVGVALEGWYGDYLKGAYADYLDREDELKGLVGYAGQFGQMSEFLAQIMLLNGETSERTIDPDQESVKLTTIHQAKGLEYDVVFVIGMAEGQFPGYRTIESGDFEEDRRLFYVAVTRARNELYLCYPRVAARAGPGGMMLQPSRFLQELPHELYDELRIKRSWGW